jgi:2-keto-4-pentenoate hydratase/2-oxohepta-3-ene-1,7-dioic acid hydratase in catechol pathway
VVDVTEALPWPHDPDPLGAGWWRRLCRDFDALKPEIQRAAQRGTPRQVSEVRLRAPILNPSKVIACAVNYGEHVAEMREGILQRTGSWTDQWMLEFDVFLKAPSSIIGPRDTVRLPPGPVAAGHEIHHESELAFVIGKGGSRIPEPDALAHVVGYLIGLDITERGDGDRSRRKSYDTFTPLGPWLTTVDEVPDPHNLAIHLRLNGEVRQEANTRDMLIKIPRIIAYASNIMRLEPGDVILTGAPPGVGEIHAGDVMVAEISGLGRMEIPVEGASEQLEADLTPITSSPTRT